MIPNQWYAVLDSKGAPPIVPSMGAGQSRAESSAAGQSPQATPASEPAGCGHELAWLGAGLVLPCVSPTFYRQAVRRKLGSAVIFFLLFALLVSTVMTIALGRNLFLAAQGIRLAFQGGYLPEITIRDGVASSTPERPFVLSDGEGILFAIDTTGAYTEIDASRYSQGWLLTRTELHVLQPGQGYQRMPLSSLNNVLGANPIVINQDTVTRSWFVVAAFVTVLLGLGLFLWHSLVRLAYLALLGLLFWGVAALLRPKTGFGPVLVTGLYASVPALYAQFLLRQAQVSFLSLYTLLLVPMWGLALAAALMAPKGGWLLAARPLRAWRAWIGLPALLAMALHSIFAWAKGGLILWALALAALLALVVVGWLTARRSTDAGSAAPSTRGGAAPSTRGGAAPSTRGGAAPSTRCDALM
jgi:hypothetical protein